MNSNIRLIDMSVDHGMSPLVIPWDPSIEDEDEDDSKPEIIELVDISCDTVATPCPGDTGNPIYVDMKSTSRPSSPDDIEIETASLSERRDLQSARSSDVAPRPLFKVMFRDESVSRQYRQQVKDFLHNLVRTKPLCKNNINDSNLTLEIWDDEVDSKDEEVLISAGNENALSDNLKCDNRHFLFTIDKLPNIKNDLDIPSYGQKYESTFEKSNHETAKDFMPKLNCFNCNGNHNLRDCPLPKNQSNISKNRKEFATKYSSGVRYHTSEDQRFSHMIPGQLSQKLKKALGLKDNQLPKHVYRMRSLGYPPGWLEEARLQHSGLSLFNSDGIAENEEDGEIITDINRDQYDIKKIYDFPGFNVPPPPGTVDDSHKYRVPQMQIMHSKKIMLLNLQGKEADDGYKRKKLKLPAPVVNNAETISDMEVEDIEESFVENVSVNGHFVPPLPKESLQVPVPPPLELPQTIIDDSDSPSFDLADDTTSITNSPSLSELERRKKILLMEIEETNSQSNSDSMSTKNDLNTVSEMPFSNITASISSQDSVKSDLECSDISFKNDFNTTLDISVSDKIPQSNSTPIRSTQRSSDINQASIKSIHLGTPILQSTSPYSKLPSSEKFSKDICDVINFENLPDSTDHLVITGTFQRWTAGIKTMKFI